MLQENAAYFPLQRTATVQGSNQTVDSIPLTSASGCIWDYLAKNGANRQLGRVEASWNADGSTITNARERIEDVGDCSDLSAMSVALSGSNILFRTTSTDEWTVNYRRRRLG